jgi:hypothetical protein
MTPEDLASMVIAEIQTGGKAAIVPNMYEKTLEEIFKSGLFSLSYIRDSDTKIVRFKYEQQERDHWNASADILSDVGLVNIGKTVVNDKHVYSLIKLIKEEIMPSAAFIERF